MMYSEETAPQVKRVPTPEQMKKWASTLDEVSKAEETRTATLQLQPPSLQHSSEDTVKVEIKPSFDTAVPHVSISLSSSDIPVKPIVKPYGVSKRARRRLGKKVITLGCPLPDLPFPPTCKVLYNLILNNNGKPKYRKNDCFIYFFSNYTYTDYSTT